MWIINVKVKYQSLIMQCLFYMKISESKHVLWKYFTAVILRLAARTPNSVLLLTFSRQAATQFDSCCRRVSGGDGWLPGVWRLHGEWQEHGWLVNFDTLSSSCLVDIFAARRRGDKRAVLVELCACVSGLIWCGFREEKYLCMIHWTIE